jgi:hypothetical protein
MHHVFKGSTPDSNWLVIDFLDCLVICHVLSSLGFIIVGNSYVSISLDLGNNHIASLTEYTQLPRT